MRAILHVGAGIGLALAAAAGCRAQAAPETEAGLHCLDPRSQAEMTLCALRDAHVAEARLEGALARARSAAREADRRVDRSYDRRPGHEETLVASQRAWARFRELQCRYEGFAMRGGTAEAMTVARCHAELAIDRAERIAPPGD